MNTAIIVGRLGADPELTHTASKMAVLRLRVATSNEWIDDEGHKQSRADWHNVTFFGPRAIALQKHLKKGDQVAVQGPMRSRSYEDKKGIKRVRVEIVAERFDFGASRWPGGEREA